MTRTWAVCWVQYHRAVVEAESPEEAEEWAQTSRDTLISAEITHVICLAPE